MDWLTRRDFSIRLGACLSGLGVSGTAVARIATAAPRGDDEISHTAAAIHQEVLFKAARARIYAALTDAKQFDHVVRLSAAMAGGIPPGSAPTAIATDVGGAFALFGGYITGRHVELVPNTRLVQAWRVGDWPPGIFSIVRFALTDQGSGTKLVFDHAGFPSDAAEHLAAGWHDNYWTPITKYLATPA